jgi:integrase
MDGEDLVKEDLGKLAARFGAKLRHDGTHQLWAGGSSKGLGVFKLNGRAEKAPRVAWLLAYGTLPERPLERTCVAPSHHRERPANPATARRARLARGDGHIRQRTPGTWTVELVAGVDPLNRRRKLRETFTVHGSFDDARALAEQYRARARLGDRINEVAHGTVSELLDLFMESAPLERSTQRSWQGYIDNHIRPAIGPIPLRELTTFELDRFYKALGERGGKCRHCWWRLRAGKPPLGPGQTYKPAPRTAERVHQPDCVRGLPLSPATVHQVHIIVHRVLAQAKKWKLLTVNVADDTTRPSVPTTRITIPKARQVATLINAAMAQDRNFGVFVWMAMITQGRRGEACGIRWSAIDTDDAELAIVGAVEPGGHWKPYPKNDQHRSIRLDPVTVAFLNAEQEAQEAEAAAAGLDLRPDGFVFAHPTTPDGSRPCDPDWLAKRFKRLAAGLGVELDRNLYALRHFGATDLIKAGVDVRTVAGRLGNDPAVTLRRYAHVDTDADLAAVTGLAQRMAEWMAQIELPPQHVRTCPHGHAMTDDNTYRHPNGAVRCRECDRIRHRRRLQVVNDERSA